MKTNYVFEAIAALDLNPIKTKLMHKASGEGWSAVKADAIELEYRRFLYLMHSFPHEQMAPTVDVDTFWHYHILDTFKYATDCEQVFGYFMHHYPYVELDSAEEAGFEARGGNRMQELYEQTFGQAYIREEAYGSAADAAYCMYRPTVEAGAEAAYCMYRPTVEAGAETAYCMYRPTMQAGSDAAYCMYRPTVKAGAQAAYCMYRPTEKAGAETAYCMYRPTMKAGADVAYCMYRPTVQASAREGRETAYCMYRPTMKAGADAAYCMYRPTLDDGASLPLPQAMARPVVPAAPILPA